MGEMEPFAKIVHCRRAEEIYREGERIDFWYRVVSGVVRTYTVLGNGRRQIVELLLPGDFFGFAGIDVHAFTAEAALQGAVVARYSRRRAEMLADSDPHLGRRIRELAFEAIFRCQARMLVFGQITARNKVGRFVMELARRQSGDGVDILELPVSRYDIADYLALSVETVSRALTNLQERGVIVFADAHRLRIVDHHALGAGDEEDGARRPSAGRPSRKPRRSRASTSGPAWQAGPSEPVGRDLF
jgi:CRP-like cAMP-binding protein